MRDLLCFCILIYLTSLVKSQSVHLTATKTCFGNQVVLTASATIPGKSIQQYYWDLNDDGYYDDATGNPVSYLFPRADSFNIGLQVKTTDGKDYFLDSLNAVCVYPLPVINISHFPACEKSLIEFESNATIENGTINSYEWDLNNDGILEVTNDIKFFCIIDQPGNYVIKHKVISDKGCIADSIFSVQVHYKPRANFEYESACAGDTVIFKNNSLLEVDTMNRLLWKFGDGSQEFSSADVNHVYSKSGDYEISLIAITNNLCSDTITKNVTVFTPVKIDLAFSGDTVFYAGNSVTITVEGNFNEFNWNTGQTSNAITIDQTGQYNVEATDMNGCKAYASANITVKPDFNHNEIIAKNVVITPNGDDKNEYLEFKDIEAYGECELIIFDRYGVEVERIKDYQNNWSGTSHNAPLPTGAYFYIIKAKDVETTGIINILRQ